MDWRVEIVKRECPQPLPLGMLLFGKADWAKQLIQGDGAQATTQGSMRSFLLSKCIVLPRVH